MRNIILTITLALLSIHCGRAQNIPSIAGVEFGTSYSICKGKFDNRFNRGVVSEQETPNMLKYFLINFADMFFDRAIFGFQTDTSGNSYLNSADFMIYYDSEDSEGAKKKRDELFEFYKSKYEFRWSDTDEDGWKYYVLGKDPISPKNGLVAISIIQTTRCLYVCVGYGPINFISPLDEI